MTIKATFINITMSDWWRQSAYVQSPTGEYLYAMKLKVIVSQVSEADKQIIVISSGLSSNSGISLSRIHLNDAIM